MIVVNPGPTQTNFSKNMLEQKAKVPMDHLRGMTADAVAAATLRALERGTHEVTLGWSGKLLVFVSRFLPRLADRIAARRVRAAWRDQLAAAKEHAAV